MYVRIAIGDNLSYPSDVQLSHQIQQRKKFAKFFDAVSSPQGGTGFASAYADFEVT